MKKERGEKYFVIGLRKIKTAEEYKNKILGHNHRNRKYINSHKNIDWNKTKDNIILQELKYKSADELIEAGNNNLKGKSRRLKKNSAFAFELIVDCSKVEGWREQDYINYLKDAYDFFKERFRGQEIVSAVIHRDERKPHLHLTLSYFNQDIGKWNQRGLAQAKLTDLNSILKDFEKDVGVKYGLHKGEGKEISKALRKALAKAVKKVEIKEGLMKTKKKKVIDIKKALEQIKMLDNKVKKLIKDAEYYKMIENNYNELKRNYNSLKKNYDILLKEKENIENLLKENELLKKKNKLLYEEYQKALQIAAQERHLKLTNKVNHKMLDKTIEKIKEENQLSL